MKSKITIFVSIYILFNYSFLVFNCFSQWEPDDRLTNAPGGSYTKNKWSITANENDVRLIWTDARDGNYEIYYKRNPTGNVIGIKNISPEIPSAYSLAQNYPNPFNPITKIQFKVPLCYSGVGRNIVKLIVFDILGKEIATLVNEQLQPGTYETTFDAGNLTSGIYFYRLQTNGYT